MGLPKRQYFIDSPIDRQAAAEAMIGGAIVAHAFGNLYALATRPDAPIVRRVNVVKGRPVDQVGSVLTTRPHMDALFNWDAVPDEIPADRVRGLMDDLFERGPIGFRGPAASLVPDHLTSLDGDVRTVQLIAPGYRCPSNYLIDAVLGRIPQDFLYVTSANRSRHKTGAEDEPAHYEAAGLEREFGGDYGFVCIRHRDEERARANHPVYAPMSTSVLAFHRPAGLSGGGRPILFVERHGSLGLDDLAEIVGHHGFDLVLGPKANRRLTARPRMTPVRFARVEQFENLLRKSFGR